MTLQRVVALALPGVAPFELGVLCELFGIDRSAMGVPRLDFTVVAQEPGEVPTSAGFSLTIDHGLEALQEADLIGVPAAPRFAPVAQPVLDALVAAVDRGARIMSVCSGAFVLGQAGLLDNRVCTTHWMYSEELTMLYPAAKIDPKVLYTEDGPILTSAGTAAGIDLGLYILRQEFGEEVATVVARRMVVPPHRDGGQAQYIDRPISHGTHSMLPLLEWLDDHLDQPLTVDDMARHMLMSPRTFARRFVAETGTTAHKWLTTHRVHAAARLLESTDLSLDEIARRSGLGDATLLRHHFKQHRGTTPRAYRAAFRGPGGPRPDGGTSE